MKFNVHAGHGAIGKGSIGAVGILNESVENRHVKDEVIRLLRLLGHTVYDCTVDSGTSGQILTSIVKKCNEHDVDLDISIHFNAGANDSDGNGKTTGVECYVYNETHSQNAKKSALDITEAISELGFKNRGVKYGKNLYVLKYTKAQAILIECCFVDDKDDAELYDAASMAEAIVYGLTGQKYIEHKVEENTEATNIGAETALGDEKSIYRVQVGAFCNLDYAKAQKADLEAHGYKAFITKAS